MMQRLLPTVHSFILPVQLLDKVLDVPVVVLRQVRGFMVQKTVVVPQLQFIVGRRHFFRAADADPHGPVCSADHGDYTVAAYFGGRCPCCAGSCRFSGAAVEKTLALPQLQLVEKSVDSGLFWVMTSGNVPVFSAYWFNTGYMSASVYGGFWKIFTYFLRQGGPRIPKSMPGAVHPRISAQCLVRQWIHAWRRDMYSAGITGDSAPRTVFSFLVRRPMMLDIMAVLDQKDSCSDMYNAGFAGCNAPLAVFLSWQAHDVLHHGRYGPEGQFRHGAFDQTAENCGVLRSCSPSRSSTSLSFRRGRSSWSRLFSRPQRFHSCCSISRSCRFIAPSRRRGFSHFPDCPSDHRCSPVAEHGGSCSFCAGRAGLLVPS